MRVRDALLVAGVAAVTGLAVAEALVGRDDSSARPEVAQKSRGTESSAPSATVAAPRSAGQSLPEGLLPGRLYFADGRCALVELELSGPDAPIRARREGACELWAPRTSDRIAYSVNPPREDGQWFRVVDLSQGLETRSFLARFDSVVWSPDGQRVAWCIPGRRGGFELEVGGRFRELESCPHAYTGSNEIVYLRGRAIYVEDRLLRVAARPVAAASFGSDGSLAVVSGRIVEVFRTPSDRAPVLRAPLPRFWLKPLFAPDNCGVLLRSPHDGNPPTVTLAPLRCRSFERQEVRGQTAAWSPDSLWFAVARSDRIEIYSATESRPAAATIFEEVNDLTWTP